MKANDSKRMSNCSCTMLSPSVDLFTYDVYIDGTPTFGDTLWKKITRAIPGSIICCLVSDPTY